ncbi:hypothetical protein OIE67_00020 [Nonomuraea fuscirosea]|uniref:hypothetical protein n=1 Tax=Nonomuraea fuscirosea TaxID=1291556 RepID=UPI002DDC570E|nr:hypothetical protein [Nonomuraea fuscirosea]WSA53061.1 hypothetical protein OIE67_00020 [Nonomuraea fuscirosea]
MPAIDAMDGHRLAVDEFDTRSFNLLVEVKSHDLAARSLTESGLLLHGVQENPLIVQGPMRALRVTTLALSGRSSSSRNSTRASRHREGSTIRCGGQVTAGSPPGSSRRSKP